MKRFFAVLTLIMMVIGTILPVSAIQQQQSQIGKSSSSSGNYKVYDRYGSLQATYKPQSNGSTRVYSKTGSYQGQYRQSGSQTRYYPKN